MSARRQNHAAGDFQNATMPADIAEWGAMNEVYVTYFPVNPPARSALGSSGLALGARVEIECLATVSR